MQRRLITFLFFTLFVIGLANAKQLYKWIDASGHIQYSDRKPVIQPETGVAKMNSQGLIIQKAESKAEKAARLKQEQQDKVNKEHLLAAKQHDKALLETYNSVTQIVQERDRKITLLNNSVKVLLNSKKDLLDDTIKLQKRTDFFIKNKKAIPDYLNSEISSKSNQIENINQQINIRNQDVERFRTQANNDIARFKELSEHNN